MKPDEIQASMVHVIFTPEGLPRWFGPVPVPGSEPLDLQELVPLLPEGSAADLVQVLWRDLLIGHCRVDGRWQVRPVVAPPPPEAVEAGEVEAGEVEGGNGEDYREPGNEAFPGEDPGV